MTEPSQTRWAPGLELEQVWEPGLELEQAREGGKDWDTDSPPDKVRSIRNCPRMRKMNRSRCRIRFGNLIE